MGSNFLSMLLAQAGQRARTIIGVALLAGLMEGSLVVIINATVGNIQGGGLNFRYFLLFVLCLLGYQRSLRYAISRAVDVAEEVIFGSQVRIADKIRRSSLAGYETLDETQVYTTLIGNSELLVESARHVATVLSSTVMLVFSAVYVATMSVMGFAFVFVIYAVGVSVFMARGKRINQLMAEAKAQESTFFSHFHHLLHGFKEVKMDTERSRDLFENHIKASSDLVQRTKMLAETELVSNLIYGSVFFFFIIGTVIFILPRVADIEQGQIVAITAMILFTIGPLSQVIMALPTLTKAEVAVNRIRDLEEFLDETQDGQPVSAPQPPRDRPPFETLALKGVSFHYSDPQGRPTFRLEPVDMAVGRGEIVFLVGGNGSGKTTLLKVLAGLYSPRQGEILLDNVSVYDANYPWYRNFFSTIMADFHLFDRLYGLTDVDPQEAADMLQMMGLTGRTAFEDGRFTNVTTLSTGQRKRLALVASYLENKPILLYDEVAADLDPVFRKQFYEVYLGEQRDRGRTIVAVSHDDRYFHVADRVFRMEYGTLKEVERS